MKITDIRMTRLWGPLHHAIGAQKMMIAKVLVRVDTDVGVYGLGEANDSQGVREAITYMKHYFAGRDPFAANAIISEMLYGSSPPHHSESKCGLLAGETLRASPSLSPTVVPSGGVVWGASAVDTCPETFRNVGETTRVDRKRCRSPRQTKSVRKLGSMRHFLGRPLDLRPVSQHSERHFR